MEFNDSLLDMIKRRVKRFANVKTRGHESLLATEVTKYIQMSSSHLSTLAILWEQPFLSVKCVSLCFLVLIIHLFCFFPFRKAHSGWISENIVFGAKVVGGWAPY